MIRIHVICEGQTEEMFVKEVLAELLEPKAIYCYPSQVGKPGHKGGNLRFERLLFDIREHLLSDTSAYCTTFFDFYGLPNDFPGKAIAQKKINPADKAKCVLQALTKQLEEKLGKEPLHRFIPYVQMYEFEGLLFSEPKQLAQVLDKKLVNDFWEIRQSFDSPETINDSPETAPSKRIERLFPEYDKPIHGSLAALEMGLEVMRRECALFNRWLKDIENINNEV